MENVLLEYARLLYIRPSRPSEEDCKTIVEEEATVARAAARMVAIVNCIVTCSN